jgi:hypothetical protein
VADTLAVMSLRQLFVRIWRLFVVKNPMAGKSISVLW